MKNYTLNNGIEMPMLGYGVYQVEEKECEQCVKEAIEVGYRAIDTAQAYYNEAAVGRAVAGSGVPREEIFLTTKIWISNAGQKRAAESIDESLRKLKTDYIDLLLIHQPFNDYYGSYRAMEEACRAGKVRAIGVSNFYPDRLIDLAEFAEIVPAVNQIETHPFYQQREAHEYMKKYGIAHQAWAPFAEGQNNLFTNEVLSRIGQKYNKTVGQTVLRFLIQQNVIVIPKTVHKERMKENFEIFDFTLEEEDIQEIQQLNQDQSAFFSHYDPKMVEMLTQMAKQERTTTLSLDLEKNS